MLAETLSQVLGVAVVWQEVNPIIILGLTPLSQVLGIAVVWQEYHNGVARCGRFSLKCEALRDDRVPMLAETLSQARSRAGLV